MNGPRLEQPTENAATPRLSRRRALKAGGTGLATAVAAWQGLRAGQTAARQATPMPASDATPDAEAIPMTGPDVPELAGLDQVMTVLIPMWSLPGGQLAVARDGRLMLNRGY